MIKRFSIYLLLALLAFVSCNPEDKGGENGNGSEGGFPKNWTVNGTVMGDDGKPLAGVVVSDGLTCVKTDSKGYYALEVDLSGDLATTLQYVFVSTPSGYSAPKKEGHAIFWEWLKDHPKNAEGKITAVDFTLKKIANPERFTIYIFGDPQPRKSSSSWTESSAFHSLDICADMYKDMKEYAATMTDRPVYGIGLGDIVHQNVSLLPNYRSGMATTGITTYNVIGNHDQGHTKGLTDEEASKAFEKVMGPTNYSFNLGNLHFLMVDNMLAQDGKYSDECATGLTDDIWTFVQNDLKLVPSSASIMICAHSPMFRLFEGRDRTGKHLSELKSLLGRFKRVYAWAGHTHATFNYYDSQSNIESHTLGRVAGALWTNEYLCENGTPRGYLVFDYDAGNISWKFKPIYWQTAQHVQAGANTDKVPTYEYRDWDYDATGRAILKASGQPLTDKYQMQVFKPGTYGTDATNAKTVYANIFLWDEAWKTPTFQLDGATTSSAMERVTESNGKLYRYSYADWAIFDFYASKWPELKSSWYDENGSDSNKKNNCASIFRYTLNTTDAHGRGTVKVKDRFGKEHTSTITW